MATSLPFGRRLADLLIPTPGQTLVSIVIALVLLLGTYAQQLLVLVGIDAVTLKIASSALHGRFEAILSSQISSTLAVVTFWAGVGLIAYLICWSAYNVLIRARNEITLTTEYTNRGHWRGPYQTLGLKVAGAAGLIVVIGLLKPGLAFWLAVAAGVVARPGITSGLLALLAVPGLATQLYFIYAFTMATFTPWYRE